MILADMRASGTRVALFGATAVAVVASITVAYFSTAAPAADKTPASTPAPGQSTIGCAGRIEPEDGVLRVTAPYLDGAPPVVAALRARENGTVTAGQVLAVLRGSERLEAAIREAEARVAASRKRLEQAQDAPRSVEVPAHEAEVARLDAALTHARTELARYETLRKTDDVSAAEVADKKAATVSAEHALEEARRRTRTLTDIRPVTVEVARAELDVAVAAVARLSADRDTYFVRAPAAGRIVKVHAHAGEQIGANGLLELARTARMYAVAEVAEADIPRVRAGQEATVTGDSLLQPITGTVERIGAAIAKSQVLPSDPAAFADTRVVPVHILLRDASAAEGRIHAKVTVTIRP